MTTRAVGHSCTGIFSADGKQGREGISLLRFAWKQEATIGPFSRHRLLWHFWLLYELFLP